MQNTSLSPWSSDKKEINTTKSYLVRWKEVGYLSDFDEWADNPHDVPFLGPDQNLYKIIT